MSPLIKNISFENLASPTGTHISLNLNHYWNQNHWYCTWTSCSCS